MKNTKELRDKEKQYFINLGKTLAMARRLAGYSQEDIGKLMGCTFQQIQKYERGLNRISIYRIVLLCSFLRLDLAKTIGGIVEHAVLGEEKKMPSVQLMRSISALSEKQARLVQTIVNGIAGDAQ